MLQLVYGSSFKKPCLTHLSLGYRRKVLWIYDHYLQCSNLLTLQWPVKSHLFIHSCKIHYV